MEYNYQVLDDLRAEDNNKLKDNLKLKNDCNSEVNCLLCQGQLEYGIQDGGG